MTWRIDLPIRNPLSLNARLHHLVLHRRRTEIKDATIVLARAARIPAMDKIRVELHYAPRDRRRRDRDNLVGTLKPALDGLVAAGVVPDDTPEHVDAVMPVIDPPTGKPGRVYLLIQGGSG